MPSKKRKFGDLGEKIAEQYLLKNGYFILEKNFQTKMGELDIIAFKPQNKILHKINKEIGRKNGLIIFVEVKSSVMNNDQNVSRETFNKIRQEENVHFKKQRHLIKSAQNYLAYKQFPLDINWQIDVIAVDIDKISRKANLRHIKQAVTFS